MALLLTAALASAVLLAAYRKAFSAVAEAKLREFRKWLLAALALAIFILGGGAGLLLAATAACVGALPMLLGQRRSLAVGALVVPSLAYSFGVA